MSILVRTTHAVVEVCGGGEWYLSRVSAIKLMNRSLWSYPLNLPLLPAWKCNDSASSSVIQTFGVNHSLDYFSFGREKGEYLDFPEVRCIFLGPSHLAPYEDPGRHGAAHTPPQAVLSSIGPFPCRKVTS